MNPWSLVAIVFVATVVWDIGRRWVRAAHADRDLRKHVDARIADSDRSSAAEDQVLRARIEALEDGAKKHNDEFRRIVNQLTASRSGGAPRGIGRAPG